jgi:hypothetical protein
MRQVDEGRGMPECRQSGACQGFGVVNRSNMPLSKLVKSAILAQNRRESGECRFGTSRTGYREA